MQIKNFNTGHKGYHPPGKNDTTLLDGWRYLSSSPFLIFYLEEHMPENPAGAGGREAPIYLKQGRQPVQTMKIAALWSSFQTQQGGISFHRWVLSFVTGIKNPGQID